MLHRGARASDDERSKAARRIAELTGLSPTLVEHRNLRISDNTFFTELLRDRGQIVGRLEARVAGPMGLSRTHEWDFDPGMESLVGPYTMAGMGYFIGTLGFDPAWHYEVLSMDTNKHWNWSRGEEQGNSFCCTSPDLSRALRRNPHLRVLVASGHYDLGTPSTASDWSLAQLDIPADVRRRVTHQLLRRGPHDVHARRGPGQAEEGPGRLAAREAARRRRGAADNASDETSEKTAAPRRRRPDRHRRAPAHERQGGDGVRGAQRRRDAAAPRSTRRPTQRSFRQAVDYTENRKVKNSRQARAMAKGTKFGREKQEEAWQSAEVDALYRLAARRRARAAAATTSTTACC